MVEVASVAGVLLIAATIRSSVGFGDGLFAMPLLAFALPLTVAAPIVALSSCVIGALIVGGDWRSIELRSASTLIAAAVLGAPLGVTILVRAPENLVAGLLGVCLVGYGLYRATGPTLPTLRSGWWAWPFGFVAGALGGAFNVAGPPVVLFGALRRWGPQRFRATLQGFFLPAALAIATVHGIGGLWSSRVLTAFAWSVPAIVAGTVAGSALNRRLDRDRFEFVLDWALVFLGVVLLVQALSPLLGG